MFYYKDLWALLKRFAFEKEYYCFDLDVLTGELWICLTDPPKN